MTTITPFLWFEGRAEEAMGFYASVFKDSKLGKITRFGDYMPGPKGEVMTGRFTICGQDFMVLNGGPNGNQRCLASSAGGVRNGGAARGDRWQGVRDVMQRRREGAGT